MRCEQCPSSGPWCGSRGDLDSPLLFVGMAPGKEELKAGIPFVGASGDMIHNTLTGMNRTLDQCQAMNVINCYPEGSDERPSTAQLRACRGRFVDDLQSRGPRIIVPLGGDALHAVCGFSGSKMGISVWRGYCVDRTEVRVPKVERSLLAPLRIPDTVEWIIPCYHPSYIMRTGFKHYRWFARDIRRAVVGASGQGLILYRAPTDDFPIPEQAPIVSFDIETTGYQVDRIGLAWENS